MMNLPSYGEAKKREKVTYQTIDYQIQKQLKDKYHGKKYFLKTYGCQMNEHDSENIKAMLEELGFIESLDMESSDLIILNTCSIRENAHNKAFGMLGRLKHLKETRKDLIYNSAKQLATKLNASDPEFKIGVICFSSNSDVTKEGTIEDATLMQTLTTENSDVLEAIENINDTNFGSRTNIEAGLELANRNFSGTADKEYIILNKEQYTKGEKYGIFNSKTIF